MMTSLLAAVGRAAHSLSSSCICAHGSQVSAEDRAAVRAVSEGTAKVEGQKRETRCLTTKGTSR